MPTLDCLAGIFVGGQSKRMLGTPKGLLQPPGSSLSLVERLVSQLEAADLSDIVLVGHNAGYAHLAVPLVADSPLGSGPMAGLLGLVEHAAKADREYVLAVACDMPFVDEALLRRLSREQADADALVPRREGWEPFCARYRVRAVHSPLMRLLGEGQYRMMSLLEALGPGCIALALDPTQANALADWDSPWDLPDGVGYLGKPFRRGER